MVQYALSIVKESIILNNTVGIITNCSGAKDTPEYIACKFTQYQHCNMLHFEGISLYPHVTLNSLLHKTIITTLEI